MKVHSFTGKIGGKNGTYSIPWPFCTKCGLVLVRNEKTRKEAAKPCSGSEEEN